MNIVDSIYKEPENWILDEHHLIHKNGTRIWICNGLWFYSINDAPINFFLKVKLWRAYHWYLNNVSIDSLGNN